MKSSLDYVNPLRRYKNHVDYFLDSDQVKPWMEFWTKCIENEGNDWDHLREVMTVVSQVLDER